MISRVKSALRSARNRAEARHAYRQLLGADENTLRDIGVSRGDVQCAAVAAPVAPSGARGRRKINQIGGEV